MPSKSTRRRRTINGEWAAEPGLLEGATGVALVLLAAVSTVEPNNPLARPAPLWPCTLGIEITPLKPA